MNLYHKEMRQIRLSRVTNFIIVLLLILSCSSVRQDKKEDWKIIVKKEIDSKSELFNNEKVYLSLSLNNYLIDFLEENKNLGNEETKFQNKLSFEEISLIFESRQLDYLVSQIKTLITEERDLLLLPSNVKLEENNSNSADDVSIIDAMTKKNLHLSYPVITKHKEFGLIAYSFGIQNEMQGGIVVYKNIGNNWEFYSELNLWIE